MEDPETYLRALTAPLAWMEEGSSLPVTRFSREAVANALVILGLLPAQRAEEILAAQRPILEAAGFRVGLPIVRFRLPGHDITITSVTLTPEGIWVRYYGDAQEGDRSGGGAIAGEVSTLWEAAWALIDIPRSRPFLGEPGTFGAGDEGFGED